MLNLQDILMSQQASYTAGQGLSPEERRAFILDRVIVQVSLFFERTQMICTRFFFIFIFISTTNQSLPLQCVIFDIYDIN